MVGRYLSDLSKLLSGPRALRVAMPPETSTPEAMGLINSILTC